MRGCAVWSRYINVCNSDVFSTVNMYLDHMKFCVLMVDGMTVVVNVMFSHDECDEPTLCLVRPIGAHSYGVL